MQGGQAHGSYSFAWFSSGSDEAARDLLVAASEAITSGLVPGRIAVVFTNRSYGENTEGDKFIRLVRELALPLETFSSRGFEPELRMAGEEEWRKKFDTEVSRLIGKYEFDCVAFVGYMLIASGMLCDRYPIVNLHPALPQAQKGSWKRVIEQILADGAMETGIHVHVATKDLDRGPALTVCRFGVPFAGMATDRASEIRHRQVEREGPLLILTLKALCEGTIDPRSPPGQPLDLTDEIAAILSGSGDAPGGLGRPTRQKPF